MTLRCCCWLSECAYLERKHPSPQNVRRRIFDQHLGRIWTTSYLTVHMPLEFGYILYKLRLSSLDGRRNSVSNVFPNRLPAKHDRMHSRDFDQGPGDDGVPE